MNLEPTAAKIAHGDQMIAYFRGALEANAIPWSPPVKRALAMFGQIVSEQIQMSLEQGGYERAAMTGLGACQLVADRLSPHVEEEDEE